MFDNFANRTTLMVLPVAAMLILTGCKEDEATAAPAPDPVDLSQTEDLFTQPVKANPLTSDPNAVVVRVNGEEITRGEILEMMNIAMQQFGGRVPPQQLQQIRGQMYEQIKNDLITKKLIDAEVAKADITVDEAKVAETIDQLKSRPMPEGMTLESALAAQGTTLEEVTENIRTEMATRQLLESKTEDVPEATEEEAKEFYDSNPERFERPENVTASHILIQFDDSLTNETAIAESKAAKKAELEKIRADIIAGTVTFEDAAKQHSDDPGSKDKGGEYEGIQKGQMVPEFEVAAFTQEIGEIGDVVETQYGYHIIKVSDREEAGTVSFDEAKEQIMAFLSGQKKQQAVADYIKSLRDSATIEEIAM